MFSLYHFLWLGICLILIFGALFLIRRRHVPFQRVMTGAVVVCLLSELVKVLSVIRMMPVSGSDFMVPYLELNHLPLHLCSIQIPVILVIRFAPKESRVRQALLGFLYPTSILGAIAALLMPSIFTTTLPASQAFVHPMAYQFFLYHAMLIVVGVSIYRSPEVALTRRDYRTTAWILLCMFFLSIYANSIFSQPRYENGALTEVAHYTNFFFTYRPPLPIALTEVWQWVVYLAAVLAISALLVTLLYLPVFRADPKKRP